MRHYGNDASDPLLHVLLVHSRQVAALALDIAHRLHLPLSDDEIEAAAMLHDIGIVGVDAPRIHCQGTEPYIRHGVIGARMLRAEGCPEWLCRIPATHTGSGLTAEDIAQQNLPLPPGDYMPRTLLEKLVCYADNYYSKTRLGEQHTTQRIRQGMLRHGQGALERFDEMRALFHGLPED